MGEAKPEKWDMEQKSIGLQEQFLYGDTDRYGIYQLKDDPKLEQFRFAGTSSLIKRKITNESFDTIKPENYMLVYAGDLEELRQKTQGQTLEAIYTKFNVEHPVDYHAHSLPVSDIVVLHEKGENSAHFVDSFGFTRLPDFMRRLEKVNVRETETSFRLADGCANVQDSRVSDFKEKANELFHEIGEMNQSEIEETVKCREREKLAEIKGAPVGRESLKERLAQKKAFMTGREHENQNQEKDRKNNREM